MKNLSEIKPRNLDDLFSIYNNSSKVDRLKIFKQKDLNLPKSEISSYLSPSSSNHSVLPSLTKNSSNKNNCYLSPKYSLPLSPPNLPGLLGKYQQKFSKVKSNSISNIFNIKYLKFPKGKGLSFSQIKNKILYEIKNYPRIINKNDQFNQKLYNHLLYLDNIVNNFSSINSYQSAEYIINKMKYKKSLIPPPKCVCHNIFLQLFLDHVSNQIEIRNRSNQLITIENVYNFIKGEVKDLKQTVEKSKKVFFDNFPQEKKRSISMNNKDIDDNENDNDNKTQYKDEYPIKVFYGLKKNPKLKIKTNFVQNKKIFQHFKKNSDCYVSDAKKARIFGQLLFSNDKIEKENDETNCNSGRYVDKNTSIILENQDDVKETISLIRPNKTTLSNIKKEDNIKDNNVNAEINSLSLEKKESIDYNNYSVITHNNKFTQANVKETSKRDMKLTLNKKVPSNISYDFKKSFLKEEIKNTKKTVLSTFKESEYKSDESEEISQIKDNYYILEDDIINNSKGVENPKADKLFNNQIILEAIHGDSKENFSLNNTNKETLENQINILPSIEKKENKSNQTEKPKDLEINQTNPKKIVHQTLIKETKPPKKKEEKTNQKKTKTINKKGKKIQSNDKVKKMRQISKSVCFPEKINKMIPFIENHQNEAKQNTAQSVASNSFVVEENNSTISNQDVIQKEGKVESDKDQSNKMIKDDKIDKEQSISKTESSIKNELSNSSFEDNSIDKKISAKTFEELKEFKGEITDEYLKSNLPLNSEIFIYWMKKQNEGSATHNDAPKIYKKYNYSYEKGILKISQIIYKDKEIQEKPITSFPPEFLKWMKEIISMNQSIMMPTESSKNSNTDKEHPKIKLKIKSKFERKIRNPQLYMKNLNLKKIKKNDKIINHEKTNIKENNTPTSGLTTTKSDRLVKFFKQIQELKELSPEEYAQKVTKLVDARLDEIDITSINRQEARINGFKSELINYKNKKEKYKKQLLNKYFFNDPITFNSSSPNNESNN